MNAMTILYIHGLLSSGESRTAAMIREMMPASKVISPDVPVAADEAMAFLRITVEDNHINQ